jgi:hypothetical protein
LIVIQVPPDIGPSGGEAEVIVSEQPVLQAPSQQASPEPQETPHAPQLVGSLSRSTHTPSQFVSAGAQSPPFPPPLPFPPPPVVPLDVVEPPLPAVPPEPEALPEPEHAIGEARRVSVRA